MKKRIFCSILVSGLLAVSIISAQQQATAGVDTSTTAVDSKMEVYLKENIPFKSPIPFATVREADVAQEWTVWREVDLRQRQNLALYFPIAPTRRIGGRVNFSHLLLDGVARGEITAYDPIPISDEFAPNQIRSYEQITSNSGLQFESTESREVSPFTGADTIVITPGLNVIEDYEVNMLWIKEKWYFNSRSSRLECRVIGICPVYIFLRAVDGGEPRRYMVPVMWIYMDEARPLLARHPVFNDFNDAQNISYDDFFMQHRYFGMIFKQSNIHNNRRISEYMMGLDALHEASSIENEIFNWEQDVWEY